MKTMVHGIAFLCYFLLALAVMTPAFAHCDTMDGPVVGAAKKALQAGDVTPVLRWVKPESEAELRAAFDKTLRVRKQGPEAQELADGHFFETLVRLHRAGEGAPYTGLKPAGTALEPGVAAAEQALAGASDATLIADLNQAIKQAVHERFARVVETKKHADDSVEAGRKYVEAYVEYIHYIERLYGTITGTPGENYSKSAAERTHEEPKVGK